MRNVYLAWTMTAVLTAWANARADVSIPLTPDRWQKTSCGAVESTADGLVVSGTDYRSGNGAMSRAIFDFTKGSDTFIRFMPVDTGYSGFSAGLEGLGFTTFTTDHSFLGSTVIAKNTWQYLRVRVNPDRTVQQVISTGDYDTNGGAVFHSTSWTLSDAKWAKAAMSQVFVILWDNYSGAATRLIVGEARTTAEPVTLGLGESLTYDFADGAIPPAFSTQGAWTAADGMLSLTTSGNQTSYARLQSYAAQLLTFRVKVDINQRNGGWDADFSMGVFDSSGDAFEWVPHASANWVSRPASSCWLEQTLVLPPSVGAQVAQWRYLEDNRYSGTPSSIPHRVAVDDVTVTCPAGHRPELTAQNAIACALVPMNAPPTLSAALSAVSVAEGQTAANDLSAADPDGDALSLTASAGEVVQVAGGAWRWTMAAVDGPATQEVTVTADDGKGGIATAKFTVDVANVPPAVSAIAGGSDSPLPVGSSISLSAAFVDPGVLDTHAATWDFGDGTVATGVVAEASGSGTASASHAYAAAGTYTVTCTVTDKDGGSGSASLTQVVVEPAPTHGTLVALGSVPSPAGSWSADPAAGGKAEFLLLATHLKHFSGPFGFAELRLTCARMQFFAMRIDSLAVFGDKGDKAQLKGIGRLNGRPGYGFQVTAVDGAPDRLRIQIWDQATGAVAYDNQRGASGSEPPPALSRGFVEVWAQR